MARCNDIADQIWKLNQSPHRSLILVDSVTKTTPSFCLFDHPYQVKDTFINISQFVNSKIIIDKSSEDVVFTRDQLPILEDIGTWKITVITRKHNHNLVYQNGESCPTALLMGLE